MNEKNLRELFRDLDLLEQDYKSLDWPLDEIRTVKMDVWTRLASGKFGVIGFRQSSPLIVGGLAFVGELPRQVLLGCQARQTGDLPVRATVICSACPIAGDVRSSGLPVPSL
jgi:hypothetical protein